MEIELGVQPNCSDATIRIITDGMTAEEIRKIKSALMKLQRKSDRELRWGTDELRGTRGIVVRGDMLYNCPNIVIGAISEALGRDLTFDDRGEELDYGCDYVNQSEDGDDPTDDPITCYGCKAIYCPLDNPLPDDAVAVGWKKCPKCGRDLYFFMKENKWRCIWGPCGVDRKASRADVGRVFAELLKGKLEISREE